MDQRLNTPEAVKQTELTIPARDGFPLAATRRSPAGTPIATALIAPATAVPRGFYGRFAAYLAEQGFDVLDFDYRGVGGSRPKSLRGFRGRMRDWAALDATAAVDFASGLNPEKPLVYVGHSFGGQALGLIPNNGKVHRALLVASQAGYWRYLTPASERYRAYIMLRFIGPLVARTVGYLPAGIGLGEGLPRDVFLEWAGWCLKPNYLFDDETLDARANYPHYKGALRAVGLADDPWATPPAIARLLQGYTGTKPEHITVEPNDADARRIGHFNYFRPEFRDTLWRDAAAWLQRSS
ncbi:MAG: alpha/beta fold hydrolase [Bradyrhizobiaceae bacterium]|nr:alpha/beta fold hydrolase [Bradyrhizobiaceae bacterium]